MIKKILVLFFYIGLYICYSCADVDVDNNARWLIKGTVKIDDPELQSDIPVSIVSDASFFDVEIGKNQTDADGLYRIISLKASEEETVNIAINPSHKKNTLPNYSSVSIKNLRNSLFTNYTFVAPTISLSKLIRTRLLFLRNTNVTDTLFYKVFYKNDHQVLILQPESYPLVKENNIISIKNEILPDRTVDSLPLYNIPLKDTLWIKHGFSEMELFFKDSIPLLYNENDDRYEFSF